MARILLLLVFAIWLLPPADGVRPSIEPTIGSAIFIGGYVVLVLLIALLARSVTSHVGAEQLHKSSARFNRIVHVGRYMIPAWMVFALYGGLGWKHTVMSLLAGLIPGFTASYHFPGLLLGTLPPLAAWAGLWWAAYPADRALREQGLLDLIDQNLPVHRPPTLGRLMSANLRQQILFMLAPIALVMALHDVLIAVLRLSSVRSDLDEILMLPAVIGVYLYAPEILRRILVARPLPDSHLRQRLEMLCRRVGLRYRDILVWHTNNSMGNAAVMGLIPRWRYILLSDLLLETMSDRAIEAVFAHEVGHIVHHHMRWYVVFFAGVSLAVAGPATTLIQYLQRWIFGGDARVLESANRFLRLSNGELLELLLAVFVLGGALVVFGFLSRRFERQADVFAARMLQVNWGMAEASTVYAGPSMSVQLAPRPWPQAMASSYVGEEGAAVFGHALQRVAIINNIPTRAKEWFHGSIDSRVRYLNALGGDPKRTTEFDRYMSWLYLGMVLALVTLGGWTAAENRPRAAAVAPTSPAAVRLCAQNA